MADTLKFIDELDEEQLAFGAQYLEAMSKGDDLPRPALTAGDENLLWLAVAADLANVRARKVLVRTAEEELIPPWEQLDAGIVPVVRALWIAGCIPWTSCEGGEGHLKPRAFVGLASSVETLEADAQLAIRTLIEAGFSDFEVARITSHKGSVVPDEVFPAYISIEFANTFGKESGSHD